MCLLTYFPAGSMPSMKDLEQGAEYNDDGHGFAIVDKRKGRLIVHKSMDAEIVLALFERVRGDHLDGPAIFHSRIGTAGRFNKENCHPFYVGGDERTVIAHNGILPSKAQPDKDDVRSDTRLLAEEFLPARRFGAVHTHGGRKALGKWAGRGNKFAVLTVDPSFNGNAFLVNGEYGDWEDGPTGKIWYSNESHDPSSWYFGKSQAYGSGWWSEGTATVIGGKGEPKAITTGAVSDPDECGFCFAKGQWLAGFPDICDGCMTCRICQGDASDCKCWESTSGHNEQEYITWWLNRNKGGE